jgi:hypothetical protein
MGQVKETFDGTRTVGWYGIQRGQTVSMAPVCVIGYSERGKYKMKRDSHYTQDTISMQVYRTFIRDLPFYLSGDTTSVLDESHEVFVRLFSLRSEFGLFALVHAAGLQKDDVNSLSSATHARSTGITA